MCPPLFTSEFVSRDGELMIPEGLQRAQLGYEASQKGFLGPQGVQAAQRGLKWAPRAPAAAQMSKPRKPRKALEGLDGAVNNSRRHPKGPDGPVSTITMLLPSGDAGHLNVATLQILNFSLR